MLISCMSPHPPCSLNAQRFPRNANYSYTNVFGQEPPWAQASASRRQNPYLKENNGMPKIEFTEVKDLCLGVSTESKAGCKTQRDFTVPSFNRDAYS